jgi:hypothetical protein
MRRRFTPQVFTPDPLDKPADDEHPRYREYVAYAKRRRFPLPFWEWLESDEAQKNHKRSLSRLQKLIDEPYCQSPLKRRKVE